MNLAAPCASASTAPAPRLFHVVALEPPLVAGRRATVDMVRVGRSVIHVQALLPPVFQEARRRGTIACSTESLPTKTRPSDRSDRPPILRRAHIALKCLSLYLKHRDLEFSLLYSSTVQYAPSQYNPSSFLPVIERPTCHRPPCKRSARSIL
jgi:hypothetical protein